MLTSTFLHSSGIGPSTERTLWQQGALNWEIFLESKKLWKIPPRHSTSLIPLIELSITNLNAKNTSWFVDHLPKKEHWRAISAFPKFGFLDIETDGGMDPDSITVIGLSDGFETQSYVKGINLPDFAKDVEGYDGFVTFFGAGFDIPFLKRRFPNLEETFDTRFHIDLCPVLKRLGHSGGLKRIEAQLGIARVPEADGLNGLDAMRLWRIYRRDGVDAEEALKMLLAYNKEDVVNMKFLLEYALPHLQDATGYNHITAQN